MAGEVRRVRRSPAYSAGFLLPLLVLVPTVHAEGDPVPPSAPLALAAISGLDGSVLLTWQLPLDDGGSPVTEYRIYRAELTETTGPSCIDIIPEYPFVSVDPSCFVPVGVSSTTTFTDTGLGSTSALSPNLVVSAYYVTAVNAAGESVESNPAFFTPGPSCITTIPEWPFVGVNPDCLKLGSKVTYVDWR